MASRDRPHGKREEAQGRVRQRPRSIRSWEPPTNVEVWKPKRKPRTERPRARPRTDAIGRPVPPNPLTERGASGDDRARGEIRGTSPEKASGAHQAVGRAILSIEKQFGRGSIMKLGSKDRRRSTLSRPDRSPWTSPRSRRHPARPDHGDLRARVAGRPTLCQHILRRSPAHRRSRRVHRRPSTPWTGFSLAPAASTSTSYWSATGTGEDALQSLRPSFVPVAWTVSSVDSVARWSQSRDRGRDRRLVRRNPGSTHSQALRKLAGAVNRSEHRARVHKPAPRKDRRNVRQPRSDSGGRALKFLRHRTLTSAE